MIFKSITRAVVAAALAASGALILTPTASAAGTCSLYVPSKVSMGSPYKGVRVPLGPNCTAAGFDWAGWDGYHPTQGLEAILFYEDTTTETWDLYDFDPIGRYEWRPGGAYDNLGNPIHQYGPYFTDVRLASYGRVTPTRTGAKVNVKTAAYRYWQTGSRFIGWSGARGQIQYRPIGGTTWYGLKDVYSNSTGTYSYTYTTSATRDYRVVLYDATTNTIWGSISPTVRR